ncbi:MAG TPA: alpha/beta fold hydrolase [Polyangiaceae bacterium]|jgi:2-succinyl-6-hydroxy-2,4-cyclohexadiene-1-carboxylate synthase|nr:alpha/beta fold hydrolase [Polyangiaceae bacterium]
MTPLLCLHGFTGSPKSWDFLPASGRVSRIVPALVGHAETLATDDVLGFEDEVDRLAALSASSARLHVVGYSLGARLALGFALRHPARVARLTLVSAHPGLATEAEQSARRSSDAAWCELLEARGVAAFVEAWEMQALWASQARLPAALRTQKQKERLSHTALGLCRSLRVTGLAEMPNYAPALAEIDVPTDVIAGALDPKFRDLAHIFGQNIRRARVEIVPDAGHDLLLERPDFITEVIRRGNQT